MTDIVKEAFEKLKHKKTTTNKVFLLKRYLKLKYNMDISKDSLLTRIKSWL